MMQSLENYKQYIERQFHLDVMLL